MINRIFLLPLILLFAFLASYYAFVLNRSPVPSDQNAYLSFSQEMVSKDYAYWGDRNRMPLYPAILTVFGVGLHKDRLQNFHIAKVVTIALHILAILFVFWIFSKFFDFPTSALFTIIYSFGYLLQRAPFTQAETLNHIFYFSSFLLMFRSMSLVPSWKHILLLGLTLALTFYSKANTVILVAAYAMVLILKLCIERDIRSFFKRSSPLIIFLMLISPYLINTKKLYGSYFYNVNSTFYVWYDSWDEASLGTKKLGDRHTSPQVPASELPSLKKYVQEHTLGDVFDRMSKSLNYYVYVTSKPGNAAIARMSLLLSILLGLSFFRVSKKREFLKAHAWPLLFFSSAILLNVLSVIFYGPISTGARFFGTIWPAYLFGILYYFNLLEKDLPPFKFSRSSIAMTCSLLLFCAFDFWIICQQLIGNYFIQGLGK